VKKCPKCGKSFDDSWSICLYDKTKLINNEDIVKAEATQTVPSSVNRQNNKLIWALRGVLGCGLLLFFLKMYLQAYIFDAPIELPLTKRLLTLDETFLYPWFGLGVFYYAAPCFIAALGLFFMFKSLNRKSLIVAVVFFIFLVMFPPIFPGIVSSYAGKPVSEIEIVYPGNDYISGDTKKDDIFYYTFPYKVVKVNYMKEDEDLNAAFEDLKKKARKYGADGIFVSKDITETYKGYEIDKETGEKKERLHNLRLTGFTEDSKREMLKRFGNPELIKTEVTLRGSVYYMTDKKEAASRLVKALQSNNARTQLKAIYGVEKMKDPSAIEPLMTIVEKGEGHSNYRRALLALSMMQYEGAYEYVLKEARNDMANQQGYGAISKLEYYGKIESIPLLEEMKETLDKNSPGYKFTKSLIEDAIQNIKQTNRQ